MPEAHAHAIEHRRRMANVLQGVVSSPGLASELGEVEVTPRHHRAPSVFVGEGERPVEVPLGHDERCRVRADGGKTVSSSGSTPSSRLRILRTADIAAAQCRGVQARCTDA